MSVIAITNQKGGVGKTTTAINIADALRHTNCDVLFIDMDPQCNATSTYGAAIEGVNTIVDVLKKDCKAEEAIQTTPLGDIIAGDTLLAQEEPAFNSRTARENLLKNAIKTVVKNYDYVIIDPPPNLGIYMINALTAADGCVIPIKAEQYAIDGLKRLIDTINDVIENVNPDLAVYGVLLTAYDARNSLDREILEELPTAGKTLGFNVFEHPIRINQAIKKIQSLKNGETEDGEVVIANRSLYDNYASCNAAHDYVAVVKEIMKEIKKNG